MTDAILDAITHRRQQLREFGYQPLPLFGKTPAPKEWQKIERVSPDMIAMWAKTWADARNTGALTRLMPALDIDILDQDAAVAVEELARERFEESGWFLVRIGKPPKRAIVFRTIEPFRKITTNLTHGGHGTAEEKLEFLCDGQQVVVHGTHPETRLPYRWHGGEPWSIRRDELPYINEHKARVLINDAAEMLCREFGYQRPSPPRSIANGRGSAVGHVSHKPDGEHRWSILIENILLGRCLHDSLRDLAAMIAASGMSSGAATHLLQALVEQIEPYDARVEARLRDLPRAVDSAYAKYSKR